MGGYQFIGSRLSDRNVLDCYFFFVFLLNFKERETSMGNLNKKITLSVMDLHGKSVFFDI
jgi:hypothetical protein